MAVGYVSLVGAGCGEADLITLRGKACLERCDVLVYDDLIDPALLEFIPESAEMIYVGKRSRRHSKPQEEINTILVEQARAGKRIVRLKGGDPFVFGRGGEEILALQSAGIPFELVPGISSCIAIPGLAGIPVTHRKTAQSFHVISGHTADTPDGLPENFSCYATVPGTLVILMGLSGIEQLCAALLRGGKGPETPAAVLSGGNAARVRSVRATLKTLPQASRDANMQSPAIIIIGDVAAMSLLSDDARPLAGTTVALTGTDAMVSKLRNALRSAGSTTTLAMRSRLRPLPLSFPAELFDGEEKWIVFTSGNGVDQFFSRLRQQAIDLRSLGGCRFAVIGAASRRALAKYGIFADLCPEKYTTEALGELLCQKLPAEVPIYLFRSSMGSKELYRTLAATHCRVSDIPLYTLEPCLSGQKAPEAEPDYIVFSSASGVDFFFDADIPLPETSVCVCIGEVTQAALRKRCGNRSILSGDISGEGLVAAIIRDKLQHPGS